MRLKISKRLLAINSGSNLLTWVLKTLLLIWLQRYLLRRVNLAEYSLYPVIMSVMAFVELLQQFLSGGVARFIVEADVRGDRQRVTEIASTMFVIQALSAVLILGLGILFTGYIDRILAIDPAYLADARGMMGLLIVSFCLHLALLSFEAGLFARQRFVLLNGLELGSVGLRILLIVALFRSLGVRVLWVVVAAESANILTLALKTILSCRAVPALRFRPGRYRGATARQLLSFSSWNFLQSVSYRIYSSFDPLILNRMASPLEVTLFYIGSLFRRQIGAALHRLTHPLLPSLIGMHALREYDRLRGAYYRYGRFYTWAFMLPAVPLVVFRTELIRLYVGEKYLAAATVMLVLFLGSVVNLGNNGLYKINIALNRVRPVALGGMAIQLVNLGLTVYLVGVRKMGALGSALGTFIVSLTLQPLLDLVLARYLLRIRAGEWVRKTVLPGLAPACGSALVCLAIRFLDPPGTWVELIGYSAAGSLVYAFLVFLLLRDREKTVLRGLFSRIEPAAGGMDARSGGEE